MIALTSDMWTAIVGLIMACSCFGKTILKRDNLMYRSLGFDTVLKNSELYANVRGHNYGIQKISLFIS